VARGVQNKVLEAMAMGKPVVATRAACRGVEAAEGEGVLSADGPEEFARQTVRILQDPELGADLGSRGRRFVERRYVWDDQLAHLEALLLDVAGFASPRSPAGREEAAMVRPA
jgi:glycosyltransferase involved in cell wall biosynthesis